MSSASGRPTLRANLRALPRPAWVLFAGTFVNRFGSFVITFLVLYLTARGFSPSQAGLAASAYGVGGLAAGTVGGLLADRLGRRNSISLSMFSGAASMLALSQARPLWLIVTLTAVVGMTSELYRPAASALLADLVPEERRVTAFAAYRLAVNAGFAAGPIVAGLLAKESFFLLFIGDAATSAVFGVVALVGLPEGTRSRRSEERRGEALRAMASDRTFQLFLLASVLASFVYFQSQVGFPLHIRASGLSEVVYGLLISLNGIIIVLIELPLTGLTGRLPAKPVMATGMLLTGLGFGLTAVAHSIVPLALTVLIWTMGEIANAPVSAAYMSVLAPRRFRGRYSGAWSMTFAVGAILGPALGAVTFEWSPTGLWIICAAVAAVAATVVLLLPARHVEPTLGQPEPGPEVAGKET